MRTWSVFLHVIATVLWVLGAALIIGDEEDLFGLAWHGWLMLGLIFHGLAHFIPGGP